MAAAISRLLPRPEVLARASLSKTGLYHLVNSGEFPEPVKVGLRRIAWREEDVQRWIESRPTVSRGEK